MKQNNQNYNLDKKIKIANRKKSFLLCLFFTGIIIGIFGLPVFANHNQSLKEGRINIQKESRYEILHFYSDWCITCKNQKSSLTEIKDRKIFSNISFKTINMKDALDLRKLYNVQQRSTIIILNNGLEIDRVFGTSRIDQLIHFIGEAI